LATAKAHDGQLSRREESLRARSELLEGRLERDRRRRSSTLEARQNPKLNFGYSGKEGNDTKALEVKRRRQKKETLQFAVSRLELESTQRQRELRKSMAAVKD
jgi:DASH complex subunit SPC19